VTGATKRPAPTDEDGDEAPAEEEEDGETAEEAKALSLPTGFTPPSQLQHNYIVVPPKLRFVTLLALLRKLIRAQEAGGKGGKVLVFMSCTEAVEFWWKALGGIEMGRVNGPGGRGSEKEIEESASLEKAKKEAGVPTAKEEKKEADKVKAKEEKEALVSLHPLLPATPIYRLHGNLPLQTRLASLAAFSGKYTIESGKKKGEQTESGVLLCTSVAARGLDVRGVGCVVQVDAPTEVRFFLPLFATLLSMLTARPYRAASPNTSTEWVVPPVRELKEPPTPSSSPPKPTTPSFSKTASTSPLPLLLRRRRSG
jgi:ATP-dependent RNA helicase DDX31/DBP7